MQERVREEKKIKSKSKFGEIKWTRMSIAWKWSFRRGSYSKEIRRF
jgi:hypothetical protein